MFAGTRPWGEVCSFSGEVSGRIFLISAKWNAEPCVSVPVLVCLALFTEPADRIVRKQRINTEAVGWESELRACG